MTRLRHVLFAALLPGLVLAPLALPAAAAQCTWNDDFTDPVERNAPVHFHDGEVCTVTLFPCPDDPSRMCRPQ